MHRRSYRVIAVLAAAGSLALTALAVRLVNLQVRRHVELEAKAEAFTRTRRFAEPWRGEIRDARNRTLVASQPVKTVYANLTVCTNRPVEIARVLAPHLMMTAPGLAEILGAGSLGPSGATSTSSPRARLLRRQVLPGQWEDLTNGMAQATFGLPHPTTSRAQRKLLSSLRHRAVFAEDDQVRVYGYPDSLAQVLGFTLRGPDGRGLDGGAGIEWALNRWLTGTRGLCVSEQDAAGRELPFRRVYNTPSVDGSHVGLTIDIGVQRIVERALAAAVARHQPTNASVLVLRPATGEILAWAAHPVAVRHAAGGGAGEAWRNHPVSDRLEPGSTLKVVTLAAALAHRLTTLDRRIHCEDGSWRVQGVTLRDPHPHGRLTVTEVLAKSSNIGMAKLALELGPQRLHDALTNFGFGRCTGIPLPGETAGYVPRPTEWTPHTLTRAAIGQGFSVTQLQLTLAVAALVNEGRLMRPLLVREIRSPDGRPLHSWSPQVVRQVVSPAVARDVATAMTAVMTSGGTGARGQPDHYTAGGKTGTAQKATARGYRPGVYTAWFIGFFPAHQPQLVVSVVVDEPRHGYYGGDVAAPVFRVVADEVGSYLGMAPDREPFDANRSLARNRAGDAE